MTLVTYDRFLGSFFDPRELLTFKRELDYFGGLAGPGLELPFADRIDRCVHQHRISTQNVSRLDATIGSHLGFDSDYTVNVHFSRQFRVVRRHARGDLPL